MTFTKIAPGMKHVKLLSVLPVHSYQMLPLIPLGVLCQRNPPNISQHVNQHSTVKQKTGSV